jgi:hypothetical protein
LRSASAAGDLQRVIRDPGATKYYRYRARGCVYCDISVQALGWYRAGECAGLSGAVIGAIIVLLVHTMIAGPPPRLI